MRPRIVVACLGLVISASPACVFWDMGSWAGAGAKGNDGGYDARTGDGGRDAGSKDARSSDGPRDAGTPKDALEAGATAYATLVLADSPLAYYRLDDPVGSSIAVDSSGHMHNATVMNGVTFGVPGQVGTGAHFDATAAQALAAGSLFGFPAGAAFTLEAWVRTSVVATSGFPYVLSRRTATPRQGYDLWVDQAGGGGISVAIEVYVGSGMSLVTPFPTTTSYVHIVATYGASLASIYVNGGIDGGANNTNAIDTSGEVDASFLVGSGPDGFYFTGDLDEIAIYDHALDGATIQQHYLVGEGLAP
jgi:hypothetical protein